MKTKRNITVLIVLLILTGSLWFLTTPVNNEANEKPTAKEKVNIEQTLTKIVIDSNLSSNTAISSTGTYYLFNLLSAHEKFEKVKVIQTDENIKLHHNLPVNKTNDRPNIYFVITPNHQLTDEDVDYLAYFVANGNIAFIASNDFNYELSKQLFGYGSGFLSSHYDTINCLYVEQPDLARNGPYCIHTSSLNDHGHPKYNDWKFFEPYLFYTDSYQRTSFEKNADGKVTGLKQRKGSGIAYFYTLPDAFSNYNLLTDAGIEHVEILLSLLPEGNVFWHRDFGKYDMEKTIPLTNYKKNKIEKHKDSPLRELFKVPGFKYAFYISLALIFIFLIFNSRRKQRTIATIEKRENTSVAFSETLSELYLSRANHKKIIHILELKFRTFIKEKYHLQNAHFDDDFKEKVRQKSNLEEQLIKAIFSGFNSVKKVNQITDKSLTTLFENLEHFYKNCA